MSRKRPTDNTPNDNTPTEPKAPVPEIPVTDKTDNNPVIAFSPAVLAAMELRQAKAQAWAENKAANANKGPQPISVEQAAFLVTAANTLSVDLGFEVEVNDSHKAAAEAHIATFPTEPKNRAYSLSKWANAYGMVEALAESGIAKSSVSKALDSFVRNKKNQRMTAGSKAAKFIEALGLASAVWVPADGGDEAMGLTAPAAKTIAAGPPAAAGRAIGLTAGRAVAPNGGKSVAESVADMRRQGLDDDLIASVVAKLYGA